MSEIHISSKLVNYKKLKLNGFYKKEWTFSTEFVYVIFIRSTPDFLHRKRGFF
jgi:hypothetical protein